MQLAELCNFQAACPYTIHFPNNIITTALTELIKRLLCGVQVRENILKDAALQRAKRVAGAYGPPFTFEFDKATSTFTFTRTHVEWTRSKKEVKYKFEHNVNKLLAQEKNRREMLADLRAQLGPPGL